MGGLTPQSGLAAEASAMGASQSTASGLEPSHQARRQGVTKYEPKVSTKPLPKTLFGYRRRLDDCFIFPQPCRVVSYKRFLAF